MTDVNSVNIIGRLTRDLGEDDFGYVGTGTARANVSIAVNRSKKQGEEWVDEVSYFDITIWGKTAENLKPYLTKGKQIGVSGHLKQDRWEKDGQKHSRVSIVADVVQLLGGKSESNSDGGYQQSYSQNQQSAFTPRNNAPAASEEPSSEEFPEDIPF
jgi:single-strand DNA-binding protein